MKHTIKRISKIVDELTTFFLKKGTHNMNINILEEKDRYKINFHIKLEKIDEEDIELLLRCLNCDKIEEMEEYYWELTGECDTDTELSIVGMMIDEFEFEIKDNILDLIIYRNKAKCIGKK